MRTQLRLTAYNYFHDKLIKTKLNENGYEGNVANVCVCEYVAQQCPLGHYVSCTYIRECSMLRAFYDFLIICLFVNEILRSVCPESLANREEKKNEFIFETSKEHIAVHTFCNGNWMRRKMVRKWSLAAAAVRCADSLDEVAVLLAKQMMIHVRYS